MCFWKVLIFILFCQLQLCGFGMFQACKPSMIGVIAPGLSIHNLVGMPDVDMEDHCCIQSEELWPVFMKS